MYNFISVYYVKTVFASFDLSWHIQSYLVYIEYQSDHLTSFLHMLLCLPCNGKGWSDLMALDICLCSVLWFHHWDLCKVPAISGHEFLASLEIKYLSQVQSSAVSLLYQMWTKIRLCLLFCFASLWEIFIEVPQTL